MASQFIIKRRTVGVGAFNRFLHRRVTTYGKWQPVAKVNFGCEANAAARKVQGLFDVGIFYRDRRLNPGDKAPFIDKFYRNQFENMDLMHQPSEENADKCRHCSVTLSYIKEQRQKERGKV